MEIYLAILFSVLLTGLIFLINAIFCHTWTDLMELQLGHCTLHSFPAY